MAAFSAHILSAVKKSLRRPVSAMSFNAVLQSHGSGR